MLRRNGFICAILTSAMAVMLSMTVYASTDYSVSYEVTYGQTEARGMLEKINEFRTGSDAWAWDSSDTQKIYYNNLEELSWDYELEEAAMQRAAETALCFSHTRPDGTMAKDMVSLTYIGENIAGGHKSAGAAFTSWCEASESYSGQGHRRNMLNENYTSVGIGHAICRGTHYWVQIFSKDSSGTAAFDACDTQETVTVIISSDMISEVSASASYSSAELAAGGSCDAPDVSAKLEGVDNFGGLISVSVHDISWNSSNASVAAVSGNVVTGVSEGSAQITADVLGQSVSATINVGVGDGASGSSVSSGTGSASSEVSGTGSAETISTYAAQEGWVQETGGTRWWYQNADGSYPADCWQQIAAADGMAWYRFDAEGWMVTGWYTDASGTTFYLSAAADGTEGRMLTGWQEIDGGLYYFEEAEGGTQGALYRSAITPDGGAVDETGLKIS